MKLLIDTNIFLDILFQRPYYVEALEVLSAIERGEHEGVVLDITLLNIDYVAHSQSQDLKDFLVMINGLCRVTGGDNALMQKALMLENDDLEDALQYCCAEAEACHMIISNDKGFYQGAIPVMTSPQWIRSINGK